MDKRAQAPQIWPEPPILLNVFRFVKRASQTQKHFASKMHYSRIHRSRLKTQKFSGRGKPPPHTVAPSLHISYPIWHPIPENETTVECILRSEDPGYAYVSYLRSSQAQNTAFWLKWTFLPHEKKQSCCHQTCFLC